MVAGRAGSALYHAKQSLAICEANGIGDFDLAYAYEAMARAHAAGGDRAASAHWAAKARSAAGGVADPDDRELLLNDLEDLPAS